jgi:methylated-DNA-[protein]-cysteine S-methyltransferase
MATKSLTLIGPGDRAGAHRSWKDRTARMLFTLCETPVGRLLLSGGGDSIHGALFDETRRRTSAGTRGAAIPEAWCRDDAAFAGVRHQLDEYFRRERTAFDLPLDLQGSPFERRVWEALRAIPYGTTTTYGELARTLGVPGAARAVGLANSRNPIAIIVPCHRVIGARGALTGYAGGLDRKRALLAHEGAMAVAALPGI